jgi:hypothetical protein
MGYQTAMCYIPRYLGVSTFVAFVFAFVQVGTSQTSRYDSSRSLSSISLKQTLAPATPCRTFQLPIQFFSETTLLVLSGPPGDCYRSVNQIALNLISIDGHVIARKPWPSTDPGLVIDAGRLVLARSAALEVDDKDLTSIQSLELPPHRFMPMILRSDQQNTVTVTMDGHKYVYGGTPLTLLKQKEPPETGVIKRVFTFADGQVIVRDGESLNAQREGRAIRKIASLEWVIPPCGRYTYCQAYDAGAGIQVSTGEKRRILVYSNGSKFPITDAAGLFPYFRLQVFDFDTGTELYREEDTVHTGQRSAAISPDGDRLATTDGQRVVVRDLR